MSMTETETETWHPESMLEFLHLIAAKRAAMTAKMRELADWFDANPTFAPCYEGSDVAHAYLYASSFHRHPYTADPAELAEQTRVGLRAAGRGLAKGQPIGTVRKSANDYGYDIKLELPLGSHITVHAAREQACEMVETGDVEEVVEYEIPDDVKAQYRKVTEKPVMERKCVSLLELPDFATGD